MGGRSVIGDVVIPKVAPQGKVDVLALQRELKSQGFDPGPLDGVPDNVQGKVVDGDPHTR